MYRDRLLKLPRRLGFDATPQALEQSRDAVETDLIEYSRAAAEWASIGSNHAVMLLNHLRETEETMAASADLQTAFLDDIAERIATSAEVDDPAQLRMSFKRYAAGLNAYARKARAEKLLAVEDLRRRRADMEAWLAEATTSKFIDQDTGLLNRAAAELRIDTEIRKNQPFCVILVGSSENGEIKNLADRLASTIRPYDMIFRWSPDRLVTIFEASGSDIAARIQQIRGWLGKSIAITVLEHSFDEAAAPLIGRIESESRQEVAA
jgi:GGDEF domain-containing protein